MRCHHYRAAGQALNCLQGGVVGIRLGGQPSESAPRWSRCVTAGIPDMEVESVDAPQLFLLGRLGIWRSRRPVRRQHVRRVVGQLEVAPRVRAIRGAMDGTPRGLDFEFICA